VVAGSADQAVSNAKKTNYNDVGMCLWYTQEWLESPHAYPDATTQWKNAQHRHAGDKNPPKGAPVFWTGGSKGYGHAAISLGGGRIRTIDCTYGGVTNDADINWPGNSWGLPYAGWSEDIGGVDVPWLRAGGGKPTDEGILGMSDMEKFSRGGDQSIPKDDNWHLLKIDDEDHYSLVTGPATWLATIGVHVAKLPSGATAQFRLARVIDYSGDKKTTVESWYPIHEVLATAGDAYSTFSFTNTLGGDTGGGKQKIRLYVKCPEGPAVVAGITSRCLHD
jgi:hypothetical protein